VGDGAQATSDVNVRSAPDAARPFAQLLWGRPLGRGACPAGTQTTMPTPASRSQAMRSGSPGPPMSRWR